MSTRIQVSAEDRGGLTLAEPVLLTLKKPEKFHVAVRRLWWVVALATFLGGTSGLVAALILPPWYESTASFAVLPIDDPTSPTAIDSNNTALSLFTHILQSRRVADQAVTQLELTRVYEKKTPEQARNELAKHAIVSIDRKANLVSLSVEDKVPARARMIAQVMSDTGREISAEIWSGRSTEHRKRLESRLAEVSKALTAAEDAMRAFREREQVVDLPEQIKASVAEAAFLARIKNEKRIGLHFAQSFGGADSPEVRRSQLDTAGASVALQGLQHGGQHGPLLALDNLPRLEEEHARLKRDIDANSSMQEVLLKQVEAVRAVESRPGGRAELIDVPAEPSQKSRPSRIGLVVEGSFLGVLIGLLFLLWPRIRFAAGELNLPWPRAERAP